MRWETRQRIHLTQVKDIQGGIIGIVDESGNPVVEYAYDGANLFRYWKYEKQYRAFIKYAMATCDSFSLVFEKEAVEKDSCSFIMKLLNVLSDYGFTFDNFNGKTLPKSGTLNTNYPDNPDLLVVLAAMGDKLSKYMPVYLKQPKSGWGLNLLEQFIFLTPAVFADNTENLPPKSLEHMASAVGGEYRDVLFKIAEKFKERGLELQLDTAFLKNRFFNQKGKDTLNYIEYGDYRNIWQNGNEQLFLRLKLNNPDAYIEEIKALPPHLFKTFTETWCANCAEKCNRRIVYHLGDEEKRACGCFFFAYKNPGEDDIDKLMALYNLEQKARIKKNGAKA